MKTFFQFALTFLIFIAIIVCSVFSVHAAPVQALPASPTGGDSELPPDFFDSCDGGESCPGRCFTDMPAPAHWSHVPIDWALTRRIAFGTSASTFSPREGCTRAQAVTFLWRAAGSPEPSATECPFQDVPANAYYRKAVLWASEKGITYGTSATAFSPHAACKRSQIITFLWRAKGCPAPASASLPFQDVSDKAYYRNAVAWAIEQQITSGTSTKSFSPNKICTREQIVTFLYKSSRT